MKSISLWLGLLLLPFLSGCYVQSLHPFYSEQTKIEVPDLLGEWESEVQMGEDVKGKRVKPWVFTADRIQTYDRKNVFSELEVVYFKLGDSLFLDFTAGQPFKDREFNSNFYWGAGVTQVHSLCKVEKTGDSLVLTPLDINWFSGRITEKKLDLPYVKPATKNSNFIFTATPEQWQQFLSKQQDDQKIFNPKFKFVFRRKK